MPVINIYHQKDKQVPPDAISIMRGTIFGNPYVMGPDGTREEVVELFRHYLFRRLQSEPVFAEQVKSLHNKTVCCCCFPKPCHGDILLKAAAWLAS